MILPINNDFNLNDRQDQTTTRRQQREKLWTQEAAQLTGSLKTRIQNHIEASEFDMYRINFEFGNRNFFTAKCRNTYESFLP